MAGYVYILSNPMMPGLLKIGYTDRDPFQRAREINQTGVPVDFVVDYYIYVSHPYEVEQKTHQKLSKYRINNNREFFQCDYETAILAIKETLSFLDKKNADFISGEEFFHKLEKETLLSKLKQKQDAIRLQKEKIEKIDNEAKETLNHELARLDIEKKREIEIIERKFKNPPFFRRLAASLIFTPLSFIAMFILYSSLFSSYLCL